MSHQEKYYQQNLGQLWSTDGYSRYESVNWEWLHLPFDDDFSKPNWAWHYTVQKPVRNTSIVEIGPAMGQGFYALKNSGIIDTSDFTGIEVSDKGVAASLERFPEAKWIQADFTKYAFTRRFDYGYERHAIHHMPEPVEQLRKVLKQINLSFSTTFRGCIQEGTISDLDKCHHKNGERGLVYFDIISVPEIVDVALAEGFNHIRILYWGKQEPISTDPKSDPYMAPELIGKKDYARYTVRFSKCSEIKKPLVYLVMAGPLGGNIKWLKYPAEVFRVHRGVKEFQLRLQTGG